VIVVAQEHFFFPMQLFDFVWASARGERFSSYEPIQPFRVDNRSVFVQSRNRAPKALAGSREGLSPL
jgi:hypothetical protein